MRCSDCVYFTRDKIGDGTGIGDCKKYDEHKIKHSGAGTPQGKCLYPNRERNCSRFLGKI